MLRLFNQVPGDGLLLSLKFKCFFLHFVYQLSELKLKTYKHIYMWMKLQRNRVSVSLSQLPSALTAWVKTV